MIDNAIHYVKPVCRIQELTSAYKLPTEPDIREALFEEKEGKMQYKGFETPHQWKAVRMNEEDK